MKLLDTHVFVELALGQQPGLTGPFAVSAMSAAELGCLVRVGRLRLDRPPDVWFERATVASDIEVLALTPRLLARSQASDWDNRDPVDRVLLQHAKEESGITLVSRDLRLLQAAQAAGCSTWEG